MAGGFQRWPEGGEAVAAADVTGALNQSNEPHGGSSLWAVAGSRSQALPGNALSCRRSLLFDALRMAVDEAGGRAARRSLASVRSQAEPGNEGWRPSDHPLRRWLMARLISRSASFFLSVSRLSCDCLPL